MSAKTRWSVLLFLAAAALSCYAVGFIGGMTIFLVIGAAFELAFWGGLLRKAGKSSS